MADRILEILTRRVRVLSLHQVARAIRPGEGQVAASLVSRLETHGLVERRCVLARPELELVQPVLSWRPGDEAPDFGKVSYRLKTRWSVGLHPIELIQATKFAAQTFGGCFGGRWPRASETTHDLNLTGVYLWHCTHRSDDATGWTPEVQLYAEGRGLAARLPDAVIRVQGQDVRFVEFGGSYGKQKLIGFHAQMSGHPYEIW